MKKVMSRKWVIVCVILLISGVSVLPSTSGSIDDNIKEDIVNHTSPGGFFSPEITNEFCHDANMINHREGKPLVMSPPKEEWNKTFGGSLPDLSYSTQQTLDGGYIVAGYTYSYGNGSSDVWLIKTDANGSMVWNRTFGGSSYDIGYSVQQTLDGGYIVAGYTYSYGNGSSDVWLIKTDANGSMVWNRTFGGSGSDTSYSVQQTNDGGYIVAGIITTYQWAEDVWLIKTDENGSMVWNRTFGKLTKRDRGHSAQQTLDGGYIITGYTSSYGNGGSDVWLIKTDGVGVELWNRTFGGSGSDIGYSAQQTSDGEYIVTGYTSSYGSGQLDVLLLKTDSDGVELWNRTFGGPLSDIGFSVQQTCDGCYIAAGYTFSYGGGSGDVWLIKTDGVGVELWNRTFGGSSFDIGYSVKLTSDHGYIVTGFTFSYGHGSYDVWLIKIESENHPPKTPDRPTGPTEGHIEKQYTYTANTTDPEMDDVYYKWDWGDGNISDWIGPYKSGETVDVSHTWFTPGLYQIRVKAQDTFLYETNWSEPLAVIISHRPLDTVFLFGLISNLYSTSEFYSFDADLLLYIKFNPFGPVVYSAGEVILISQEYLGVILLPPFGVIFGFFSAAVI